MKVTCGTDIIEISRIKKAIISKQNRFLKKIYTQNEINYCEKKNDTKYEHYAVRFAAKEAIYKALNNLLEYKISWLDVEIINNKTGKPEVIFLNKIKKDLYNIEISMSHCKEYAIANVIVISKEQEKI